MDTRPHHFLAALLALACTFGCAPPPPPPASPSTRAPEFELNFVGVCAADWPGAFRFYTEVLGLRARSREGRWAMLGAGWEAYRAGRSRGLVFELFEGAGRSEEVSAGRAQAITLGIQVRDLPATMQAAAARGVQFVSPLSRDGDHQRAEFTDREGIHWFLHSSPAAPAGELANPEITRIELRVQSLREQLDFYQRQLGLRTVQRRGTDVILGQTPEGPRLILKPGGHRHTVAPKWKTEPAFSQPVFLSFMTRDVRSAAAGFRRAGRQILRKVTHHEWGGTDLILADADGNAVQIVEFDTPRSFGERQRTAPEKR